MHKEKAGDFHHPAFFNAGDRNRTGTVLPQQDFKSCASASSATPAHCTYHVQVGPTGLEPVTPCL